MNWLTASLIEHCFLTLMAASIIVECLLTVLHTHAAEKAAKMGPGPFAEHLTQAEHERAAQFAVEHAQSRLVLHLVSACFALAMTYGGGFSMIASVTETLFGSPFLAELTLFALVLLMIWLVSLPFDWFATYRLKRRFGYSLVSPKVWFMKTTRDAMIGWVLCVCLSTLGLMVLESSGSAWWVILWLTSVAFCLWRWYASSTPILFWGRKVRPYPDARAVEMFRHYLKSHGYEMTDCVLMRRPPNWRHSHIAIVGMGVQRKVVIFSHAYRTLNHLELLALLAHEVGHLHFFHRWVRVIYYSLGSLLITAFLGWGAQSASFFEGFGFAPSLTVAQPGSHVGFTLAVALIVLPTLLFPVRPLCNLMTRFLQYLADRFVASNLSALLLERALVKLHRDKATSLAISPIYSLFHYKRPHAGMRIENLKRWTQQQNLDYARPQAFSAFNFVPYQEGVAIVSTAPTPASTTQVESMVRRYEPKVIRRHQREQIDTSMRFLEDSIRHEFNVYDDVEEAPATKSIEAKKTTTKDRTIMDKVAAMTAKTPTNAGLQTAKTLDNARVQPVKDVALEAKANKEEAAPEHTLDVEASPATQTPNKRTRRTKPEPMVAVESLEKPPFFATSPTWYERIDGRLHLTKAAPKKAIESFNEFFSSKLVAISPTVRSLLPQYREMFGEHFPFHAYWDKTDQKILSMLRQALASQTPVSVDAPIKAKSRVSATDVVKKRAKEVAAKIAQASQKASTGTTTRKRNQVQGADDATVVEQVTAKKTRTRTPRSTTHTKATEATVATSVKKAPKIQRQTSKSLKTTADETPVEKMSVGTTTRKRVSASKKDLTSQK